MRFATTLAHCPRRRSRTDSCCHSARRLTAGSSSHRSKLVERDALGAQRRAEPPKPTEQSIDDRIDLRGRARTWRSSEPEEVVEMQHDDERARGQPSGPQPTLAEEPGEIPRDPRRPCGLAAVKGPAGCRLEDAAIQPVHVRAE